MRKKTLIVLLILSLFFLVSCNDLAYLDAKQYCLENGYRDAIRASTDDPWYCIRTVNASDEIVPLCDLIKCDKGE